MEAHYKDLLKTADLMVDKIYEGGRSGNASDDPLPHLIGVSNQGGFRYIGTKNAPRLAVLTSTMKDLDWPDRIDTETGIFTYFGDNKKPGHELHDTPRFGNLLLRDMFEHAHGSKNDRAQAPPVLIFANTGTWRDVQFLGWPRRERRISMPIQTWSACGRPRAARDSRTMMRSSRFWSTR